MKGRSHFQIVGLLLLLLAAMAAGVRVIRRGLIEADRSTPTLRFAHTLLDPGVIAAFDRLSTDYETLQAERGRRVRVRQITVPDRVYKQWVRTKLVGGTAPEIILTSGDGGDVVDDNLILRFLTPLAPYISAPNPYNAGTSLADARWRDTFFDGMEHSGYHFRLAEHIGIPTSLNTQRMFVNVTLARKILDDARHAELRSRLGVKVTPESYDDFVALCRAAAEFSTERHQALAPIAGSAQHGRILLERMFGVITQRMVLDHSAMRDMRFVDGPLDYVTGRIAPDNAVFRAAFSIQRELAQFFQPGFAQMQREDATFYFTQGRALMIAATARDAPSLGALAEGRFEMGVFALPTPQPDHPVYGKFVVGPVAERDPVLFDRSFSTFSVVNQHSEEIQELAIDFLRFLSSQRSNERFSEMSGWLPIVVGAKTPARLEPFTPRTHGFLLGPQAHFNRTDFRRIMDTNLHRLSDASSSVEDYIGAVARDLRGAAKKQARDDIATYRRNTAHQDTLIAAQSWLAGHDPERASYSAERLGILLDSATANEFAQTYLNERELNRALTK